jgi:anaerobic selenocysteine-containing dehydrogenase
MTKEDGSPRYPGGYADYIVNHERAPGIGPLAGFRGKEGASGGVGEPNPDQLQRYIENGCHWYREMPAHMRYFRFANRDYLDFSVQFGFNAKADPIVMQLYCEALQKFRLAARGHGAVRPPPAHRERIERYFDPLPMWYPPFEEAMVDQGTFPMHALTQRPMAMYHSWGSQNAWLRQIIDRNVLYMAREKGRALGIGDGDWVWVESAHGRIRVEVRLMEGVNPDTVWTWNAIGKRSGAWNLEPGAPEARKGFLLNHLISDLLPEKEGAFRYSNSDPVTGQAAWFDLRVRISKATDEAEITAPQFGTLKPPPGVRRRPSIVRWGVK